MGGHDHGWISKNSKKFTLNVSGAQLHIQGHHMVEILEKTVYATLAIKRLRTITFAGQKIIHNKNSRSPF
jgi:hypothetical protein